MPWRFYLRLSGPRRAGPPFNQLSIFENRPLSGREIRPNQTMAAGAIRRGGGKDQRAITELLITLGAGLTGAVEASDEVWVLALISA